MLQFVDAQQMHKEHPKTFEVPTNTELAAIVPGDSVKVCAGRERFWVTVTEASESTIQGKVDNDLVCTEDHGLSDGDSISFSRKNVYAISKLEGGVSRVFKTVLFDLDGTLADLSHRIHHIKRPPINWDAFFAACGEDTLIEPIHELAVALAAQGYTLVMVSGRSDRVRAETQAWLERFGVPCHGLHMRRDGDHRQDFIVKSEFLDELLAAGHDIRFVVDDRPSVVAMWRKRGLTCLQCRDWQEDAPGEKAGQLTVMVGPSGAGKSTWLASPAAAALGIHPSHIVSSDQIRSDLCGDSRDQSRNDEVFAALRTVVNARLSHGLPAVVDATNLRRKDRLAVAKLGKGEVRYLVIDRPMADKERDAGRRSPELLQRHAQVFGSNLKDILVGDGLPNVVVTDLRGTL